MPQPEALVQELHGRLVAAAAAAGVPADAAIDPATAGALLGREAANSFGVCRQPLHLRNVVSSSDSWEHS